jgi:hypothetical protein
MYIAFLLCAILSLSAALSLRSFTKFSTLRNSRNAKTAGVSLKSSEIQSPPTTKPGAALTQKEYLIAVRNRLFAVQEQIWLHEYAIARPNLVDSKVEPLREEKYDQLCIARGQLLEEYPLTRLHTDLYDAQLNNMTYAAMYLERLIGTVSRQLPMSMEHVNQIAVLSFSGQVINLMRGQGLVYHRLLPSNTVIDQQVKRQFQHPAFSSTSKYLAFAEMHFKEGASFVKSNALVFEVPKDPSKYGSSDSMPLFDSGELPGAPFFMRFSPNDESLVMLCTSPGKEQQTSLMMVEWGKFFRKDSWAGQAAVARFAPRKALTLLTGNPVFFTYTTANAQNATVVAHCTKEVESVDGSGTKEIERAVWMLQKEDTGGVQDYGWRKVSDCSEGDKWSTPICHSAGGGDSVLLVEDGYLVTKALSRWKRSGAPNGELASKKIMKVTGQVQFLVSPDGSRAVVLEEDINIGHYSLRVIEGEDALDPSNPSTGNIYDLPHSKLTVAFWFSPDSTKVLLLTANGKSREDVQRDKSAFRVGLNSEMQWSVYNAPLQELREYDSFKPTSYFMKTYVPFFSQYAQVYNPWAPDSRSFIYMTASGLLHVPLVGSKHCVGQDRWQNQGATFGTWSRS